jgi:plastocyanin
VDVRHAPPQRHVRDKATRTFAEPGTFAYVCSLHAGMVGTVVVK